MEVVEYREEFQDDFIRLNVAWIEKYFAIEDEDRKMLSHIDEELAAGGMIYVAVENGCVAAVCMTIPEGNGVWEICKLAADDRFKGKGAGSAVFKACMEYAIRHGARKLMLISNRLLGPALHIYEKFGFREVAFTDMPYARGDVRYEYTVPSEA